jgi:hypothetical protein
MRIRMITLVAAGLLAACSGGGDGGGTQTVTAAPEGPVAWRGALIVGERPQSGLPHVEAGWQQALAVAGPGPEPRGWTIRLVTDEAFRCANLPEAAIGCFDPRARTITASWALGAQELEVTLAEEFCHFLRVRRGLPTEGGACPT